MYQGILPIIWYVLVILQTEATSNIIFQPSASFELQWIMLSIQVAENLLPEGQAELFTELIQDIVRQVKADPNKLPMVSQYLSSENSGSPVAHRPRERERDMDPVLDVGRVSISGRW